MAAYNQIWLVESTLSFHKPLLIDWLWDAGAWLKSSTTRYIPSSLHINL